MDMKQIWQENYELAINSGQCEEDALREADYAVASYISDMNDRAKEETKYKGFDNGDINRG